MTGVPEWGIDQAKIDFLMLADWAETINGKLYIQGGGWDRRVVVPGKPMEFAIVASIVIPWNATNRPHEFSIAIESEDGTAAAPPLSGSATVGRPPHAQPGQDFRTQVAVKVGGVKLPALGTYRIVMTLNGDITKSAAFHAVAQL